MDVRLHVLEPLIDLSHIVNGEVVVKGNSICLTNQLLQFWNTKRL